jgi:hypothetical protein
LPRAILISLSSVSLSHWYKSSQAHQCSGGLSALTTTDGELKVIDKSPLHSQRGKFVQGIFLLVVDYLSSIHHWWKWPSSHKTRHKNVTGRREGKAFPSLQAIAFRYPFERGFDPRNAPSRGCTPLASSIPPGGFLVPPIFPVGGKSAPPKNPASRIRTPDPNTR